MGNILTFFAERETALKKSMILPNLWTGLQERYTEFANPIRFRIAYFVMYSLSLIFGIAALLLFAKVAISSAGDWRLSTLCVSVGVGLIFYAEKCRRADQIVTFDGFYRYPHWITKSNDPWGFKFIVFLLYFWGLIYMAASLLFIKRWFA